MNRNDIKALRKTLGLSQQEFGRKVGVERSTVSSWERGLNTPKGFYANNLQAIFDDCPQNPDPEEENSIRKKNARYRQQEEAENLRAASIKAINKTFTVGKCYTVSESRLTADGNILQQPILCYERKEGIHHVFREIRGKWIVTYTDAQLIGKFIREVDIDGDCQT